MPKLESNQNVLQMSFRERGLGCGEYGNTALTGSPAPRLSSCCEKSQNQTASSSTWKRSTGFQISEVISVERLILSFLSPLLPQYSYLKIFFFLHYKMSFLNLKVVETELSLHQGHSPNIHNSLSWTRLKPGARNSIRFSLVDRTDKTAWASAACQGMRSRKLARTAELDPELKHCCYRICVP